MPQDFDFSQYSPEVQQWVLQQMDDAMCPMRKGECYINSVGYEYRILEDSPAGELYVKAISDYPIKGSIRYISKAVILSQEEML